MMSQKLEPQTLVEMITLQAKQMPNGVAFHFDGEEHSYASLCSAMVRVASHLQRAGLKPGARVLVVLPNGSDFFHVFYGILAAGGIAVPLYAESPPTRIDRIARHSKSEMIVVANDLARQRLGKAFILNERSCFVAKDFESPLKGELPPISADDIAFIQYTSGSTGNPKGVQLPHRGLLINIQQMITGMKITNEDRFVSWLPVCHDMGLILMTMVPFYLGLPLLLLPSSLAKVHLWLRAIDQFNATFTAAPDFAYRLCLRYIQRPEDYDIKTLRVALNAAEPVRAQTVSAFEARFGLERVVCPAYGLAEATVGVSCWSPGEEIKVDEQGLVCVGQPFPQVQVRICDQVGNLLPNGSQGQIVIESPANCKGYLFNDEATKDLWLVGEQGLITGDLGYCDEDGNLFVVGRAKNVIISAGRTIAPQEIEEVAESVPNVRLCAALGIPRKGTESEQIYVFIEMKGLKRASEAELHEQACALVAHLRMHLGYRPARLYLCKLRTIPRTPNGKIQHFLLKQAYLSGALKTSGALLYPEF